MCPFSLSYRMTRLYEKLHKSMGVLDYFTLNSWNWSNDNLLALHEAMQPEDKEVHTHYFVNCQIQI